MTRNKDMEYLPGQLEMYIKAIIRVTLEMDMGKCFGVMEVFIKANGKMEFNMDKVSYMFLVKG